MFGRRVFELRHRGDGRLLARFDMDGLPRRADPRMVELVDPALGADMAQRIARAVFTPADGDGDGDIAWPDDTPYHPARLALAHRYAPR